MQSCFCIGVYMVLGKLDIGTVFLAPMAGVTDLTFRKICHLYGADMTYTEMISAKAFMYRDRKTYKLIDCSGYEGKKAVQIFGSDPFIMADAARELSEKFDVIDINMGCPMPKITGNKEGSALLKNLHLAGNIVQAVSEASKVPVTVKIRRGWDEEHEAAVEVAKIAEENGAAAIAVHPRYTKQMYSGKADKKVIKAVREAVIIPVIGNGDIYSAQDAISMLEDTGCSAVMVGRGALGNPFIFKEIHELLETGKVIYKISEEEKIKAAIYHIKMLVAHKGEHIAVLEARKHVAWYVKGTNGANNIRRAVNSAKSVEEIISVLTK